MMGHGWLFVEAVMMGCATILARGMYSRPILVCLWGGEIGLSTKIGFSLTMKVKGR